MTRKKQEWTFVLWLSDAGDIDVAHGIGLTKEEALQEAIRSYMRDMRIEPEARAEICESIDLWCAFEGHHENLVHRFKNTCPVIWNPKKRKKTT